MELLNERLVNCFSDIVVKSPKYLFQVQLYTVPHNRLERAIIQALLNPTLPKRNKSHRIKRISQEYMI